MCKIMALFLSAQGLPWMKTQATQTQEIRTQDGGNGVVPKGSFIIREGQGLCSIKVLPRQHEVQGQQRRHQFILVSYQGSGESFVSDLKKLNK